MAWTNLVQLCGGFVVEIDGVRVQQSLPGRQGRLTVAYLAAHEDRWITRDELTFAIWGNDEPPDVESAVSSLLSKIRRVLGPDMVTGRSSLRFQRDHDETHVDMHFAKDALHRAQVHMAAGEPRLAWQPAHTAYSISDRRFMSDHDAPWIDDMRDVMETVFLNALECETRALIGVGEVPVAEHAARKLVQRAPFRESGYFLLMSVLEQSGNRAEALLVYDKLRRLLADELGTTPGPEVAEVHRRLLGTGA